MNVIHSSVPWSEVQQICFLVSGSHQSSIWGSLSFKYLNRIPTLFCALTKFFITASLMWRMLTRNLTGINKCVINILLLWVQAFCGNLLHYVPLTMKQVLQFSNHHWFQLCLLRWIDDIVSFVLSYVSYMWSACVTGVDGHIFSLCNTTALMLTK